MRKSPAAQNGGHYGKDKDKVRAQPHGKNACGQSAYRIV